MSTIAEIELPAKEFALRTALERTSNAEFDVVRVAAHDSDHVMPYLWVSADDMDALDSALREDRSVEELTLIEDLDDERLYRMHWVDQIHVVIHILVEEQATILNLHGKDDRWRLRILFPDRDSLSATYDFCQDTGLSIDVRNIYEISDTRHGLYGLTEEQHETLMMALEGGYYDVPRESTADDLADNLSISHQAVSERLRRGHRSLVKNALAVSPNDGRD
ncbi:DNA-binding protein [Haladaptatus sp. R4]|uniref:helix-turn-helix domain-containing protein n=1 Tax=Haladaptatus sp. R4 TaxID=1679489 RepID=UPI0007B46FD1|nr:helix-turn-helix domain-containing protein [Haladaptatus sp. R4]KZN26435.1 DNA-binding protein [Haladaptatus sp. R4]